MRNNANVASLPRQQIPDQESAQEACRPCQKHGDVVVYSRRLGTWIRFRKTFYQIECISKVFGGDVRGRTTSGSGRHVQVFSSKEIYLLRQSGDGWLSEKDTKWQINGKSLTNLENDARSQNGVASHVKKVVG